MAPTLKDILNAPNNGVTPLRLLLAVVVVFEHAWRVITPSGTDPGLDVFGMSPAYAAVNGFFILSGALITKSLLESNADMIAYWASRLLRLMPLLIAFALVVLAAGPFISSLSWSAYWQQGDSWAYSLRVIFFLDVATGTPGAFSSNPAPGFIGVQLWTLRYELLAYIAIAAAFLLGLLSRRVISFAMLTATIALAVAYDLPGLGLPPALENFGRFGLTFMLGVVAWQYRDIYRPRWWHSAVTGTLVVLAWNTPAYEIVWAGFLGSALFWLSGVMMKGQLPLTGRGAPDFSYGLYVWHFFILQLFIHLGAPLSFGFLIAFALPASLLLAALSWYLVEKPSLALKKPVTTGTRALLSRLKLLDRPV
jgi:peptidoglycan/LPS O-acetylase OafA/YrhL